MKNKKSKSVRGGQIENIGPKRQLITWNQGRRGRNIRIKVNGTRETAEKILQKLREEFYAGTYKIRIDRDTTIAQLAEFVVEDYLANNYRDLRGAKQHRKFWLGIDAARRADTIDADQLMIWSQEWRAQGKSPARVNRHMSFLLRGFSIACEREILQSSPRWTPLQEAPPRSGTRTWQEFVAVRAALPPHARVPISIEYWLGTRSGETHSIEWSQIQFHHASQTVEIRLKSIDVKTGEQRMVVLEGDLYEILKNWRAFTKEHAPTCRTVCQYRGKPLKCIKTAWATACVRVGLGHFLKPDGAEVGHRQYRGAHVHDFRRTAVTRMEDAGVPRKVAMAISGHKTDSVYRRYHIVKKADLVEAGRRIMAHHAQEHGGHVAPEAAPEKVFSKCSPTRQKSTNHPGSARTRRTPSKQSNAAPIASK